jgi:hypothetical protein
MCDLGFRISAASFIEVFERFGGKIAGNAAKP